MGRGLAAILTPARELGVGDADQELVELPVELLRPNPRQPRADFDEAALVGLADSLRERGVLQPVLVRPVAGGTYELIAGERRWRAAQLAGFASIPALVRAEDDAGSLELALIENMVRQDLNPVEEARACALLVEELGLTREAVGRRVGRSRVAVSNLLRLLELPDEVLGLLVDGVLTEGHGRALLMAGDHGERRRLARAAATEGWTVRRVEEAARATGEETRAPARSRRRRGVHPDQEAAAEQLEEAFGRVLGDRARVLPDGAGYRLSVPLGSLEEALAVARRLGDETSRRGGRVADEASG